MKTTVILVRHAQTHWNKERRITGQSDVALSEIGIQQAQNLRSGMKQFGITQVYASTLQRAIHTAQLLTKDLKIEIKKHKGLNERNFGAHEGKLWNEVMKNYEKEDDFFLETPENGESLRDFAKRVIHTFEDIVKKHTGETILIVCHGAGLYELTRHLKKIPHNQKLDVDFQNTSVSVFEIENKQVTEKLLADISHLE